VDPAGADPAYQLNHASLNLAQGHVVFGFGGNDGDCPTYWGWLVSVAEDGSSISDSQVAGLTGDSQGAIWSPSGPMVDGAGSIYAATGNSLNVSSTDQFDYSEAVLRFPSASNLQPADYLAPSNFGLPALAGLGTCRSS
jgi:hypothetical protein